jgi:ribosomal protein L25 (general stress protein Ctc)
MEENFPDMKALAAESEEQEEAEQPEEQQEAVAEPEEEEVEDRGEEAHEEYQLSDVDANEESKEPYDPNEVWSIDINCKNKVKSLKKLILERLGLKKKADLVLMKEVREGEVDPAKRVEKFAGSNQMWLELTKAEQDLLVKDFADKTMAFKAFMKISVEVFGRGQSYKTQLYVDPKDPLEATLKKRTLFWKTFMTEGNLKCALMVISDDKEQEDVLVEPEDFQKTFLENNVSHNATLLLVELRNMRSASDDEEADEGGEDEQEEPEEHEQSAHQQDQDQEMPKEDEEG